MPEETTLPNTERRRGGRRSRRFYIVRRCRCRFVGGNSSSCFCSLGDFLGIKRYAFPSYPAMLCKFILYVTVHPHVMDKVRFILLEKSALIGDNSLRDVMIDNSSESPVVRLQFTYVGDEQMLTTFLPYMKQRRYQTYHRLQFRINTLYSLILKCSAKRLLCLKFLAWTAMAVPPPNHHMVSGPTPLCNTRIRRSAKFLGLRRPLPVVPTLLLLVALGFLSSSDVLSQSVTLRLEPATVQYRQTSTYNGVSFGLHRSFSLTPSNPIG